MVVPIYPIIVPFPFFIPSAATQRPEILNSQPYAGVDFVGLRQDGSVVWGLDL